MNPKIIYHYTSLDALVSILDSDNENITLRASQAKFLNDYSDCKLYTSIFLKTISKMNVKATSQEKKDLNNVFSLLQESYITSFSENADDLTMWRGYGINGLGITIGFNYDLFSEIFNEESLFLIKCEYSREKLLLESTNLIHKIVEEKNYEKYAYKFILSAFKAKNPKYQHEKEWRLCNIGSNILKTYFRSTGKTIIPFIEQEIPKTSIKEIIIGPCLKEELIKDGIIQMLEQRNFDLTKIKVKISKVPFRHL